MTQKQNFGSSSEDDLWDHKEQRTFNYGPTQEEGATVPEGLRSI